MTDKPFVPLSSNAYKRLSRAERLAYDIAKGEAREAEQREERRAYVASPEGRLDALEARITALEERLELRERLK